MFHQTFNFAGLSRYSCRLTYISRLKGKHAPPLNVFTSIWWQIKNLTYTLKGTYHTKSTLVRLLYMNMCPRGSRELTKCQKTQPSLSSSIPKSLKKGLQRIWSKLIQIWTLSWRQDGGATAIRPTLHLSGEYGVRPRPAIAARKRWRRCSTYARPVGGAVLTESDLAKTDLNNVKLSEMRHG